MIRRAPPQPVDVQKMVGARIRQRRVAAGMQLTDFALAMDIAPSEASRYEAGIRPMKVPMLFQAARVLKCRVVDLVDDGKAPTDGLTSNSIRAARLLDGMASVGFRNTLLAFIDKAAAYDKERAQG